MKFSIPITEQRKLAVYEELCRGSDPRTSFFILVAVSTLIASFGLVTNSTAVVIGAMLVAPLMTPILGLALGLVRGDPYLIRIAGRSEVIGVSVSILAGMLLASLLPSHFEATPEMLARTGPSLFDLLVAVLAGFAGAYAMVDEKLSPILPGVAIATAIVPPLANCGMCIALGAYEGAGGSFLLFFANFLSILLVTGFVFRFAGMSEELHLKGGRTIVRRFGIAAFGFLLVAALLSYNLSTIFKQQRLFRKVKRALESEFANLPIHDFEKLAVEEENGVLMVRADVIAPDVIPPRKVKELQNRLSETLEEPARLFVRTVITYDVSATGSIRQYLNKTLDGLSAAKRGDPRLVILQTAEQVIREYLDERRGITLNQLNIIPVGDKMVLLAQFSGVRSLTRDEIGEIEASIQKLVTSSEEVSLLVQTETSTLADKLGGLRTEFNLPRPATSEEKDVMERAAKLASDWLSQRGFWLESWTCTILEKVFYFLLEVKGPELFSREEQEALNEDLAGALGVPVELYVRTQLETVVGPRGNLPFAELLEDFRKRNRAAYADEIRHSVVESR